MNNAQTAPKETKETKKIIPESKKKHKKKKVLLKVSVVFLFAHLSGIELKLSSSISIL